jgi:hypothetical protein
MNERDGERNMIIEDIQRQIGSSQAVVAEISSQNPNVF